VSATCKHCGDVVTVGCNAADLAGTAHDGCVLRAQLAAAQAEAARLRGALEKACSRVVAHHDMGSHSRGCVAAAPGVCRICAKCAQEDGDADAATLFYEAAALSSPAPVAPAIEAKGAIACNHAHEMRKPCPVCAPELRADCVERNPPAQSAPDPMRLALAVWHHCNVCATGEQLIKVWESLPDIVSRWRAGE
jgi:hypothetical protein